MRDEQSTGGLGRARSRGAMKAANAGAIGLRRPRTTASTHPCHRRVQGRHVLQTSDALGAAGVQLGPGVVALVVELHTEMGVPLAKVAHLLRTTFGLQVTPGGLAHVLHRAARAAAPAYTELCEQVRSASRRTRPAGASAANATGYGYSPPRTTVYAICPGRGLTCHGAGDRLRRRARARRVGAVSLLRRAAQTCLNHLLQRPSTSGRTSIPTIPGPARCRRSCSRPRPAGPLQRGRAERARDGHSPRPPQRPPRSADRRTAAARRRRALRGAPGSSRPCSSSCGTPRSTPPTGAPNRPSGPPWSSARCAAATAPATVPDTQQVLASIVRTARQRGLDLPPLIAALLRAPEPAVPELPRPSAADRIGGQRPHHGRLESWPRAAAGERVPTALRSVTTGLRPGYARALPCDGLRSPAESQPLRQIACTRCRSNPAPCGDLLVSSPLSARIHWQITRDEQSTRGLGRARSRLKAQTRGLLGCGGLELRPQPTHTCFRRLGLLLEALEACPLTGKNKGKASNRPPSQEFVGAFNRMRRRPLRGAQL